MNKTRKIIISAILLLFLNVFIFVIPFKHSSTFWVAYIFGLIATLLFIGIWFYSVRDVDLKSKLYGIAVIYVAAVYMATQLLTSLIYMIFSFLPVKIPIISGSFMLCLCLIGLLTTDAGKEELTRIDKEVKEKTSRISFMKITVDSMIPKIRSAILRKKLKDLSEIIRYSDPISPDSVQTLESEIEEKICILEELINERNEAEAEKICGGLIDLLHVRNNKVRALK